MGYDLSVTKLALLGIPIRELNVILLFLSH